jgi:hypothetical protein
MKPIWKYLLIAFFTALVLGYLGFSLWYFSGREKETVCRKLEIVMSENNGKLLVTETEVARILDENELNPIGRLRIFVLNRLRRHYTKIR